MIEIDAKNPPKHITVTPQELLQRIALSPDLKLGWAGMLFLKELVEPHVESAMEFQEKDGKIRITLYQPNEADIKFLTGKS